MAVRDAVMLEEKNNLLSLSLLLLLASFLPASPPILPCSPPHDLQQSVSSGNAGTSGRVGANFCPKTSPSQLLVESSDSSSILGAG